MVFNDFEQNPLIVPLKTFKAHDIVESLGLCCFKFIIIIIVKMSLPFKSMQYFIVLFQFCFYMILGVLHCEFHPTQPWVFSCGFGKSSHEIKLFV